jgi:beta-lactamase class A
MGLFGRNKKEEEFDAEGGYSDEEGFNEEEELKDRKLTRKFRDLNPRNKRKRKEPPKPWGKKERVLILGFFLVTTVLAAGMFLFSHDFKFPGLPKITISKINLKNPFGEEIIEIGQKGNASQNDQKAQAAVSFFNDEVKPLSGFYGFTVLRFDDGVSYGVSSDGKFQGASLLKLPLMVLMYKMSEDGTLNLGTKYTLKSADKVSGSGVLYTAKVGTIYTYRELAEYMGKDSDRTAYKIIKDVVGESALKDYLTEIGMKNTNIDTGDTTPNDIKLLLQKLWNGNLVNQTDRDEILGFLENTIYENWITAGVPKGVVVAHKFGQDAAVLADGGIIFAKNPYILVIMGNGITEHDADILFPKVSKDVYDVENSVQ